MNPEIHASIRTRVCALIGELGTMLGHLDTAAEFASIPAGADVPAVQIEALATALDEAANAAEGTLRREFGDSLEANATHGSDAPETAAFEMGYFFSGLELLM